MKRRFFVFVSALSILAILLTSCSAYKIKPGNQAYFETLPGGSKEIAAAIEEPSAEWIIQSPAAFFTSEAWTTSDTEQSVKYVTSAGASAYIKMLTEILGFEMAHEDLGYVYNTWRFVKKGSDKVINGYEGTSDVTVRHYYDSSGTVRQWIDVSIDGELFSFGELGLRPSPEDTRSAISGRFAKDTFALRDSRYFNYSTDELSVRSGVKKDFLYTYTKPFASTFYGYECEVGQCALSVNGEKADKYQALLADYETFNNGSGEILLIYDENGNRVFGIEWGEGGLEVGKVYTLAELLGESSNRVSHRIGEDSYLEKTSAKAFTLRPLWLDKTGDCESLVYFFCEFMKDGEIITVEGLAAAPYCRTEDSEKLTGGKQSSSGGIDFDFDDDDGPFVPEFAKLDCLTCRGDGDCNDCGGYGIDYYGDYKTKCNTCYGSGNCRACGGSGKR